MWCAFAFLLGAVVAVREGTPRRIIQTSAAGTGREDWIGWTKLMSDKNPGFEMQLFDDDDALEFIEKNYNGTALPHAFRYFVKERVVMATDLFRYAVVGTIGGFCVCRCIRDFIILTGSTRDRTCGESQK